MTGITIQPGGMTVDGVVAQRVYLTGSDTYYQDNRSKWFRLVDGIAKLTTPPTLRESPPTTMITGIHGMIVDSHRNIWRITGGGRVSRDVGAGPGRVDEDVIKVTALYYDHGGRVHRRGTDGGEAGAPKWWYWEDWNNHWHDEVNPTASALPPEEATATS